MEKNTNKKDEPNKKSQKRSSLPLLLGAAVILCLAIVIIMIPKESDTVSDTVVDVSNTGSDEEPSANVDEAGSYEADEAQVIEAGESLIIPVNEVSSTARFYPIEIDGTRMEVLAVMDSSGNIRTAFNTCQICYGSGRGYYVQDGDMLVCQNCGNQFTVDQVEIESGGCNPWPIFAENKTVTEDSIEISYDFLKESKEIFANWKISY